MAKLPPAGYVPDMKSRKAKAKPAMHHPMKKKVAKKREYTPIGETKRNRFQK